MWGAPGPTSHVGGSFLWGLNAPAREDGEGSQDQGSLSPLGLCPTQRATEGRRVLGVWWSSHRKRGSRLPSPSRYRREGPQQKGFGLAFPKHGSAAQRSLNASVTVHWAEFYEKRKRKPLG